MNMGSLRAAVLGVDICVMKIVYKSATLQLSSDAAVVAVVKGCSLLDAMKQFAKKNNLPSRKTKIGSQAVKGGEFLHSL